MLSRLRNVEAAIIIICVTYVGYLFIKNDLNIYIHPRYIIFTITMTACAFAVTLWRSIQPTRNTHRDEAKISSSHIPFLMILIAAIILPARSLTSATISQRIGDEARIATAKTNQPINALLLGSSKALKIGDWSRILLTNTDENYYINKPAQISGFLFDAGLGEDTVWLARFAVTCCAVDAQPIGVPVRIENWNETYKPEQWLEANGEFREEQTTRGPQIVLVANQIKEIKEPENPYAN